MRRRHVLVASLLGVFVSLFPILIVVASLPEIAADLSSTEATLGWVLTAPLIASAVVLPTCGRLGDLHGHRRLFLIALSTSGVFAVLAAFAWSPLSLIVFRTVSQAAGTAASPSAIALVISAHEPSERPRVLGFWAFSTAIAPALGLLVGGPAVAALSWRGLFGLQAIVVTAVVVYATSVLGETGRAERVTFDLPGAAAFMVASGSVVFGLDRAGRWGWRHEAVVVSFGVAAAGVAAFLWLERRVRDPILPADLLRHGTFLSSCSCELLVQIATNGALFVVPLVYHEHYGAGVGRIAWYMAPMPLGMALVAPLGGRIAHHVGERTSSMIGFVALTGTLLGMIAGDRAEQVSIVLLFWFAVGVANGLIRPAIASAAAAALEPTQYGTGMAATRMISTVGAAAGITLAISLLPMGGFDLALAVCAGAGAIGTVTSSWLRMPMRAETTADLEAALGSTPGPLA